MIFINNSRIASLLLIIGFLVTGNRLSAQNLVLMDVNDGNRIVNDGVITVDTSDLSALELSAHLKILNNTDKSLAIFMKKIIHREVDSTSNYFCLYPKCWPDADSTDFADSIPAGLIDSSFVTHYDHYYRNEKPIPPGFTSITYLFYDYTTFPEHIEARVTINYLVSGVGVPEPKASVIKGFPNPASDKVTFTFNPEIPDPVIRLNLYNIRGQLVRTSKVDRGTRELLIDVNSLEDGIYRVLLCTQHHKTSSSSIIISR